MDPTLIIPSPIISERITLLSFGQLIKSSHEERMKERNVDSVRKCSAD